MKIGVSSCLLGYCCKYDGKSNYNANIIDLSQEHELIPICPEVLGGLSIPRFPAEIINGKVINTNGDDVTENYYLGANKALEILKNEGVEAVILKSKSPSCGINKIYDGTFSHTLINGNGVAAQLFIENNIKVYDENTFKDLLK